MSGSMSRAFTQPLPAIQKRCPTLQVTVSSVRLQLDQFGVQAHGGVQHGLVGQFARLGVLRQDPVADLDLLDRHRAGIGPDGRARRQTTKVDRLAVGQLLAWEPVRSSG